MQFDLHTAQANKSTVTSVFYGLNRTRRGVRGEMEDMVNMSSYEYPCAAPRGARYKISECESDILAAIAPDSTNTSEVSGLTGITDGGFYYNGVLKSNSFNLPSYYRWEIVRKGNLYIINGYYNNTSVMYYYNIDTDKFDNAGAVMDKMIIAAGKESGRGNFITGYIYGYTQVLNYSVTDINGNEIENKTYFKKYGNGGGIASSENIFSKFFSVGDEISISGFPSKKENVGQVWKYSVTNNTLTASSDDYSLYNTVDTDVYSNLDEVSKYAIVSAVVKGFSTTNTRIDGYTYYYHHMNLDLYDKNGNEVDFDSMNSYYCSGVTISKRSRCLDNISVHHGRIWGTSPTGNMIYASSSDDIFSFSAADIVNGYAARLTSDTPGTFIGICEYGSDLIAFKKDSITAVIGTGPSNYSTYTVNGIGCIDKNSVSVTPYGVIFLSHDGFYCYSGGTPSYISDKLRTAYVSAVSGFFKNIYYTSAVREDGARELLTCDLKRGLWHIQDDTEVCGFFEYDGSVYFANSRAIYKMTDCGEDDTQWSFTTVRTIADTLDNKAVNEIWIRAWIYPGAEFTVSTAVDDGEFVKHETFTREGLNVLRCPVRAVMGSSYRIHISGRGRVVFYELEPRTAVGGRRYMEDNCQAYRQGGRYVYK